MSTDQDIAAATARAFEQYMLRPPEWKPHPHQVPPDGDWYGWLLLAGRGAGKTDACSNYVEKHVKGPPCLGGAVPHWISIVAPTLGDAVTACYAGPSGIRAHSPDAKMVQSAGGTIVRWPNGSQAKMFGAQSPEDVERLRAGGNSSLTGDTLVATEYGQRRLDQIEPGHRVWTRNGLRRVLAVHEHGHKPIWEVKTSDGRTLHATGDHKIWTGDKWCRVDELRTGGNVATWPLITLSSTTSAGTDVPMATTPTHDVDYSTVTPGPSITEQFRKSIISTISTTIAGTTTSPIWWRSTDVNTHVVIPGETYRSATVVPGSPRRQLLAESDLSESNHDVTGTVVIAVDGSRTRTLTLDTVMLTYAGKIVTRGESALSATMNLSSAQLAVQNSAVNGVDPQSCGDLVQTARHTPNDCAVCAEHSLPETNEVKPELAHARVLCVRPYVSVESGTVISEPVYDITVEHDHEFIANGVLVLNCLVWMEELAAWRYLQQCYEQIRFGLRSGTRPHWIASTTPKPRPLIKKLVKDQPHNIVITRASTDDNPHLQEHVREALYDEYGGAQIGRQELHAEILDEDKNALWRRKNIDDYRIKPEALPQLRKITVGVDPSGGAGEQGIIVVGKSVLDVIVDGKLKTRAEGYVLDDRTVQESPDGWGRATVRAAVDWEADDIVVETNFGGDMAVATIAGAAEKMGINIPIRQTRASRGKRVRAEPVAALSERGMWHHVGNFELLEDQLVTWTEDLGFSPDRLDAMVWPAWHNRLVSARLRGEAQFGGRAATLRIV